MKHFIVSITFLSVLCTGLFSKNELTSQMFKKSFLIIKSTTEYVDAKEFAEDFAKKSGIKINLRSLHYSKKIGLTQTMEACISEGYDYPCYVARGRYDDGVYISIEYSNAYVGFTEGYYIVMIRSEENIPETFLHEIKMFVPDAYIKYTSVYMGCMH
jgi:hypothetical protein